MKKLFLIPLLALLCVSIASAEKVEINYSIEVHTFNGTPGRFDLFVDGSNWGNGVCDGTTAISPKVQIIRTVSCGDIERGSVDTLAEDMRLFVSRFNDTRVYCLQDYSSCQKSLTECQINKQHKDELLENCNGTNSDWYSLYQTSQQSFQACSSKTCYDNAYITQLKDDAKNQRWMDIGMTAAIVGAIAYALYFKKGMAQNPYNKV